MSRVPVLDWRRFADPQAADGFVTDLGRACRDTGFFLIAHHGIPETLIDESFAAADRFFALPEAEKRRYHIQDAGTNRGWTHLGQERLDPEGGLTDRKEAFNIGLDLAPTDPRVLAGEPFRAPNVWPDLPGFRGTLLAFFDACHALSVALHRPIARDLGLEEGFFEPHFDAPLATLRLLRYPGGPAAADQTGAGAHTDYGSLTLLATDGVAGLQVQPRGGDWLDVPHVPGALIVNIADCLMRWTNDIYVSTPHRVLAPAETRRSLAFFLDPNPDSVIQALPGTGAAKYPPVTGAAYLRQRLDATYGVSA